MITVALLTLSMGSVTALDGGGSLYVMARLGPWGDPVCGDARTTDFGMQEFLWGVDDEIVCIDGTTSCLSFAETRIDLRDDGFTAKVNGWGEATGLDIHDAFSRHDVNASMNVAAWEDLRVHISWNLLVVGLGTVFIEIQRMGDLGGPDDQSPPIVSRYETSYIDPISLEGVDVLRMPQGRWRFRLFSTHQAMDTKKGFAHSFARTTHIATYVELGDVNGDGAVNVTDLLTVIDNWGTCDDCLADLNGDGQVGVADLLQVLADWDR